MCDYGMFVFRCCSRSEAVIKTYSGVNTIHIYLYSETPNDFTVMFCQLLFYDSLKGNYGQQGNTVTQIINNNCLVLAITQ